MDQFEAAMTELRQAAFDCGCYPLLRELTQNAIVEMARRSYMVEERNMLMAGKSIMSWQGLLGEQLPPVEIIDFGGLRYCDRSR